MKKEGIISKLWGRAMRMRSIRLRIRHSYLIIIALMLLPIIVSIALSVMQTRQYNAIITNVSSVGRLSKIIQEDIPDEIFNIVAGNKTFEDGQQYAILEGVKQQLGELTSLSTGGDNAKQIFVANRAITRLESYIDELGVQIRTRLPVEMHEGTLEEIRGVADLITDLLQEYILLEIEVAADMNSTILTFSNLAITSVLISAAFVCAFAVTTQMAVSKSISQPIYALEVFAGRIAKGDLFARAESTKIVELKELTASLNIMAEKIEELMEESIREQENLKKSEMRTLQAQITPHFVYNTLDAIVWLAESRRNDEVVEITKAMSSFFRIALSRGQDWISVSQEIEHVESYLIVQHTRYRDILTYTFDVDENLCDQLMLKLVLQPLVENAIYHGIKLIRGRGTIAIKAWLCGDKMCFTITDNGLGMKEEKLAAIRASLGKSGTEKDAEGYGLYNVDKRIRLYYGSSIGLTIDSEYGKGTTVEFSVPVRGESTNV